MLFFNNWGKISWFGSLNHVCATKCQLWDSAKGQLLGLSQSSWQIARKARGPEIGEGAIFNLLDSGVLYSVLPSAFGKTQ